MVKTDFSQRNPGRKCGLMEALIDINILISAALTNKGTPYHTFIKAVSYPNHGLVYEQNIDELRHKMNYIPSELVPYSARTGF